MKATIERRSPFNIPISESNWSNPVTLPEVTLLLKLLGVLLHE